ncbi:MAG: radical SAM protein [Candidatus Omnitrophota bacterium]
MRELKRKIYKAFREPVYALSVLRKRLDSLLSYYFWEGKSSWPETVSLFLTYNCNLGCSMCGYWGKCGSLKGKPKEELKHILTIGELQRLIDELTSFKPNITLFGGEPFLYPDWPRLIKYIKAKKLRVNVVSNATLLAGREKEVVDSGLDEIIFSLEGPSQIHDRITNVKGSFEKSFNALEKIVQLKKENNIELPKINVAVTISEDNLCHLYETFKVAQKLFPDTITFHHLSFIDKDTVEDTNELLEREFGMLSSDWKGFLRVDLPKIDPGALISEINKIRSDINGHKAFFYPDFSDREIEMYYKNFKFESKEYKNRCLSPWMTVYIFPDGRVGPCEEFNIYFGNIKTENFKDIWNNASFRKFRTLLKKKKMFPVCSRCTELYRF